MRCVDRSDPAQFTLSDVAADLGVTRQTVYRYFPGTGVLFAAVGQVAGQQFTDELSEHLAGITATVRVGGRSAGLRVRAASTAALPHAAPRVRARRTLRPLLHLRGCRGDRPRAHEAIRHRLDRSGYDEDEREALVEYMLRSLQSLVIDPPDPAPTGPALRTYLRRWIAPAVAPWPRRNGDEATHWSSPLAASAIVTREAARAGVDGVVPAGASIPLRAGGVTPRWLEAAMGLRAGAIHSVPRRRRELRHGGSRPASRSSDDADVDVPDHLFLKFTPHNYLQRVMMLVFELGTREVFVYRTLGEELPVRMPRCYGAEVDALPRPEPDDPGGPRGDCSVPGHPGTRHRDGSGGGRRRDGCTNTRRTGRPGASLATCSH